MFEKLKPCPFCGCPVEILQEVYPTGEKDWRIYGWHSDKCYFNVAGDLHDSSNERNLIRAWNRRTGNGKTD